MPESPRRVFLAALALLVAMAALPAAAHEGPHIPIGPNSLGPCPGDPITPTLTITGTFPQSLIGSYVMLPFEVPAGRELTNVLAFYDRKHPAPRALRTAFAQYRPEAEAQ